MWRTGRASRRRRPTSSRRGRPRANSTSPGTIGTSRAAGEQLPELVVAQPVEERDVARRSRACGSRRRPSDGREVAVDEVDRHRALADGRRDPLHRVRAARRRRRTPRARSSPARTAAARAAHRCACRPVTRSCPVTTKPLSSRTTVVAEPVGARRGADEDEQPARRRPPPRRRCAGRRGSAARGGRRRRRRRPRCGTGRSMRSSAADPLDEVLRHARLERRPAHEQRRPGWRSGRS